MWQVACLQGKWNNPLPELSQNNAPKTKQQQTVVVQFNVPANLSQSLMPELFQMFVHALFMQKLVSGLMTTAHMNKCRLHPCSQVTYM